MYIFASFFFEIDLSTVEHLIEKVLTYTYKLNDGESGRTHYGMIAHFSIGLE